jgi:hypothetical protein
LLSETLATLLLEALLLLLDSSMSATLHRIFPEADLAITIFIIVGVFLLELHN